MSLQRQGSHILGLKFRGHYRAIRRERNIDSVKSPAHTSLHGSNSYFSPLTVHLLALLSWAGPLFQHAFGASIGLLGCAEHFIVAFFDGRIVPRP